MKRIVTLLVCLVCLACLLAGCGKKQSVAEVEELLPTKQADSLVYANGKTTLRFTNVEDKWVWSDGESFPLDDSTIQEILARLPDIFATVPIRGTMDLATCGLAEPTRYLTVSSETETKTLYIGTQGTNNTWYMRLADSDSVCQIPDDFVQLLNRDIYQMAILPTLPELAEDSMTFIGVSRSEEENTYLLHADGAWKSNGKDVADTAAKILAELADMKLERCVDYFPAAGVDELCGLAEGATTATLKYTNSVGTEAELVLTVGSLMESGEGYYITIGESPAIYCMAQDQLHTLLSLLPDRPAVSSESAGAEITDA